MRGEKQNNIAQKLGGMEALPAGVAFDKWQAWQKLEPALHKRKRRWLWLPAAAVVIGVGLAGYFMLDEASKPLKAAVAVPSIHQPIKEKKVAEVVASAKKTKATVEAKPTANKQNLPLLTKEVTGIDDKGPTLTVVPEIQVHSQSIAAPDTATTVTATVATPPKPRFKIAHVNELYIQPTPMPDEPRKATAFSIRRKPSAASDEAAPLPAENTSIQKKNRAFLFSSLSASQ